MAPPQKRSDARKTGYPAKPNIRKSSQQPSVMEVHVQGKRRQGVKKERPQGPVRRSARLEKTYRIQGKTVLNISGRKRRTKPPISLSIRPSKKRRRTSLDVVDNPIVCGTTYQEAANGANENKINPIDYWLRSKRWPKIFFKQDGSMSSPLARRKSTSSLRRKGLESSATTPSDQRPREEKSAPYKNPHYRTVLETKGSFMDKSSLGITDGSKALIKALLDTDQPVHDESLFGDDLFDTTCWKLAGKNETRVMLDIMRLIVPSAEILATYGATKLECLIEGTNEAWNCSIPFYGPRPQPDYSVGFRRSAFTDNQLVKLKLLIDDWDYTSLFMATDTMYLPFLICEVKCGEVALDVADRQNAHSATIAVRATVELFKLVKCEIEVDREILAFSISHDHTAVRIYGHYAVLEGEKTNFHRHPIHKFDFTSLDGKEKWTAYKFTRNVYDKFVPIHLKRICAAIDQIPLDLDFDVSHSDLNFSQRSNVESFNADDGRSSQGSFIGSENVTPTTSFTRQTEQTFKRPRKKQ
ncbi:hypothetical protein I7I51_06070 [Histoplasma capsulatum]|uniref:DUF7924 domain-containing protein n=1 Tax=Ajellomyces capsulatus TaxID=5037 RepID=A0A8A1MF26_AJECA|nr:hypothetical protein I7I51_06070 [Histoplasma capsulatum]